MKKPDTGRKYYVQKDRYCHLLLTCCYW